RARHVVRGDFYRDSIRFRRSIQIANLNKPELRAILLRRDRKLLDHLEMAKSPRLRTEPAAVADIHGQNFALELFSVITLKQDLQLSRSFQCRHNAFFQSAASLGRRLQREPVICMRSERDDVARFPDRPKEVSTENLHGYAPREAR